MRRTVSSYLFAAVASLASCATPAEQRAPTTPVRATVTESGEDRAEVSRDPRELAALLEDPTHRAAAAERLARLTQSPAARSSTPDADPASARSYIEPVLARVLDAFDENAHDADVRASLLAVLVRTDDARAVTSWTALLDADEERELPAVREAITDLARVALEGTLPAPDRGPALRNLSAYLAHERGRERGAITTISTAIDALVALHDPTSVDTISALVHRPFAQQSIHVTRAACYALGAIGGEQAVASVVYGLFLTVRHQNAAPHCRAALARIGPDGGIPALVGVLRGRNQDVNALLASYPAPGDDARPPPDLAQTVTAEILGDFGDPAALAALLSLAADRGATPNARITAATAAVSIAGANPESRAQVTPALVRLFDEALADPTSTEGLSLDSVAELLARLGERETPARITRALRAPAIQGPRWLQLRAKLLMHLARSSRHTDAPAITTLVSRARREVAAMPAATEADRRASIAVTPLLDAAESALRVSRTCFDADVRCLAAMLDSEDRLVVQRAAQILAWDAPVAQRDDVRGALLAHVERADSSVRRALLDAIDAISPTGCTACVRQYGSNTDRSSANVTPQGIEFAFHRGRLRARMSGGP